MLTTLARENTLKIKRKKLHHLLNFEINFFLLLVQGNLQYQIDIFLSQSPYINVFDLFTESIKYGFDNDFSVTKSTGR